MALKREHKKILQKRRDKIELLKELDEYHKHALDLEEAREIEQELDNSLKRKFNNEK